MLTKRSPPGFEILRQPEFLALPSRKRLLRAFSEMRDEPE
jgi:hypothetical protein